MYVKEPVRVAAATATIPCKHLLGIEAISGDVVVYKGSAATAANKISSCTGAQGNRDYSDPISVDSTPTSLGQNQIHVTVSGGTPEAIIYVSR